MTPTNPRLELSHLSARRGEPLFSTAQQARTRIAIGCPARITAALALGALLGTIAPAQTQTKSPAPQNSQAQTQKPAKPPAAAAAHTPPVYADLRARAWNLLNEAADSNKVRDRSDGLSAISILKSDRHAIALLKQALQDKDESVRTLAANSLGSMNARSAIPALRDALNDPSPVVSFAAAQSLWRLGDRSGRQLFYEVLLGQRKTMPGLIKQHVNEIKKDIHDPKTLALIGIDQASGAFLGPFSMGVSVLEEYAKNTSSPVQAYCATLLSQDPSPDTIEQLSLALGDNNWTVRAAAAKALAEMHDRKVISKLEEMMETDKVAPARLAAAAAIVKLTE